MKILKFLVFGILGVAAISAIDVVFEIISSWVENYIMFFLTLLVFAGLIVFGAILHYGYIAICNLIIHIKRLETKNDILKAKFERGRLDGDKTRLINVLKSLPDNHARKEEIQSQIDEIHKKVADLRKLIKQSEDQLSKLKFKKFK